MTTLVSKRNLRRAVERTVRGVRIAWSIIGLTLILVLVIEICFRIGQSLFPTRQRTAAVEAGHPYASEDWYPEWQRARSQHVFGQNIEYDPYRGWRVRPGRHEGLLVLPSGYRHSVQFASVEAAERRQVLLFGGSTMWGFTARDHATIPSLVAAQLADAGIDDVEILNHAQAAYNVTQSIAALELELRQGVRPAAVVFLDGVNELGPVVRGGRPGQIYEEAKIRQRFEKSSGTGLLIRLVSRLRFVQALRPTPSVKPLPAPDTEIDPITIAEYYANMVRVGVALAQEFDFEVFFYWQPTLAMTGKTLGPWEAREMAAAEGTLGANAMKMIRACAPEVDRRLADYTGKIYFPLHDLFDQVQGDQFLDHYGHVTEQANAKIAAAIAQQLVPVL